MKKLTQEEFINKSKEKHNNFYDYSKAIYKGRHDKVIITCPIHGDFKQSAGNHYLGATCKKCTDEKTNNLKRCSQKDYILKAKEIHKDKYDYSKMNYFNSRS